ncbi:CPBP family intramembrane glutamic endopeptidase [Paraglaciecola sp. L3A3]|uniref:CPBP family intramembrane glutamic endopeptidase n=1 Tax=Paraglaciecola sp. L3A3 TaxID=2686358 RepID=UPI00131D93C8|nr:CPBP family intramembrane glutamic endopeptidase [Paraglaciecola sp. L3A3]
MFALFVITPILLATPVHFVIKLSYVLAALVCCITISRRQNWFVKTELVGKKPFNFTTAMTLRFITFVIISTALVWYIFPETLFSVVLTTPWLWLAVSLFYALFSVYPQEFLYRLFFIRRYQHLLSSRYLFLLLNAFIFSLAHTFLANNLVFILTFVGGVLFTLTFKKSQSLVLVSLEHSAYGVWLFTLGLGKILAFPGA